MKIKYSGIKFTLVNVIPPRTHKYFKGKKVQGMTISLRTNQGEELINMYEGDTLNLVHNLTFSLKDFLRAAFFGLDLGNTSDAKEIPPKV